MNRRYFIYSISFLSEPCQIPVEMSSMEFYYVLFILMFVYMIDSIFGGSQLETNDFLHTCNGDYLLGFMLCGS